MGPPPTMQASTQTQTQESLMMKSLLSVLSGIQTSEGVSILA